MRSSWIPVLLLLPLAPACSKGETAAAGPDKQAYETAIAEVNEMVGVISAFLPYAEPKLPEGAYAPKQRPDLERAATVASNAIRSAANRARQRALSSSSAVSKELAEPFIEVTKACQNAADAEAWGKCKAAVKALDEALGAAGSKATAAGVTSAFPRVGEGAISDAARKELEPLATAIAAGKAETAYYAKLTDEKVSEADVVGACKAAEEEATATIAKVEKIDEEVRKVAVVHQQTLVGQCARLGRAEQTHQELEVCKKDAKSQDCALACGKARAIVDGGLPAAAFVALERDVAELCPDDE